MNEFVRRVLEGRALWGTLDVAPASRGLWERARLTVYPPGITSGQRRLLHLRHTWPVAGGILGLFALIPLSDLGPVLCLATVLGVFVGGFVVIAGITRELRARCRVLTVAAEYVGGDVHEYGDVPLLRAAAARLAQLESARASGLVGPVEYEAEWGAVYDSLSSFART